MGKVTSKLQLTLPRAVADRYGIRPGSVVAFEPAGSVIVLRPIDSAATATTAERLSWFDATTVWLESLPPRAGASDRGWTRDDLYDRALPR